MLREWVVTPRMCLGHYARDLYGVYLGLRGSTISWAVSYVMPLYIGRFAAKMGLWVACLVRAQIPLLRVVSIRAYIGAYLEPPGEEYQYLYKILLG